MYPRMLMPSLRALAATSWKVSSDSSIDMLMLWRAKVSEAAVNTAMRRIPALAARSRPTMFGTRAEYVTPPAAGRPPTTSSASASCGTATAVTNEVASIDRSPAATRSAMNVIFAAAGIARGSF